MTVHVKMWRAAGVSVHTPRRLQGNFEFPHEKTIPEQKKNHYCLVQDEDR